MDDISDELEKLEAEGLSDDESGVVAYPELSDSLEEEVDGAPPSKKDVKKGKKIDTSKRVAAASIVSSATNPAVGSVLGGVMNARNEYKKDGDKARAASVGVSTTAGSGVGGSIGVAVGTAMLPVVGSVVGGVAGSVIGGLVGKKTGKVIVPKKDADGARYEGYKKKLSGVKGKSLHSDDGNQTDEQILEDVKKSEEYFTNLMVGIGEENPFSEADVVSDDDIENTYVL